MPDMRVLAIETASEACSIALFDGAKLIAHDHRVIGRGHAEQLVPMIEGLPAKGRADRIVVSLGPGSFTGVRIGIATARALGFAWQVEVLGYPTLALVAAMAQSQQREPVTVCMTGGHGEWFVQDFDIGGQPETLLASLPPESVNARTNHRMVAGSKAQELANIDNSKYFQANTQLPDASKATLLSETHLSSTLTPIYGRAPDAKPQIRKSSNSLKSSANFT